MATKEEKKPHPLSEGNSRAQPLPEEKAKYLHQTLKLNPHKEDDQSPRTPRGGEKEKGEKGKAKKGDKDKNDKKSKNESNDKDKKKTSNHKDLNNIQPIDQFMNSKQHRELRNALQAERERVQGSPNPSKDEYKTSREIVDRLKHQGKDESTRDQTSKLYGNIFGPVTAGPMSIYLSKDVEIKMLGEVVISPYEEKMGDCRKEIQLNGHSKPVVNSDIWDKWLKDYKSPNDPPTKISVERDVIVLEGEDSVDEDKKNVEEFLKENAFKEHFVAVPIRNLQIIYSALKKKLDKITKDADKKSVTVTSECNESRSGFGLSGPKTHVSKVTKDLEKLSTGFFLVSRSIFVKEIQQLAEGAGKFSKDKDKIEKDCGVTIEVKDLSDTNIPNDGKGPTYMCKVKTPHYCIYVVQGDINTYKCDAILKVQYHTKGPAEPVENCAKVSGGEGPFKHTVETTLPGMNGYEVNAKRVHETVYVTLQECTKKPIYSLAMPAVYTEPGQASGAGVLLKAIGDYLKSGSGGLLCEIHIVDNNQEHINTLVEQMFAVYGTHAKPINEPGKKKHEDGPSGKEMVIYTSDDKDAEAPEKALAQIEEVMNREGVRPALNFPECWEPTDVSKSSGLSRVKKGSSEYKTVAKAFSDTTGFTITQIERIQNVKVYQKAHKEWEKDGRNREEATNVWTQFDKQSTGVLEDGFSAEPKEFHLQSFNALDFSESDGHEDKQVLLCLTLLEEGQASQDDVELKGSHVYPMYLISYR